MAGLTKVKGSGLATGAATASLVGIDDNATSTAITIAASERVTLANDLVIPSTGIIYLDGAAHTYIREITDSVIQTVVGGVVSNTVEPGRATFWGDIKMGTAGGGIDFSADGNAAGMTSEVLDDYEEGTWTPTLAGSTASPSVTYGHQNGYYTKIGRMVHLTFNVYITGVASNGSGTVYLSGMPFSSSTLTNQRWAGSLSYNSIYAVTGTDLTPVINQNYSAVGFNYSINNTNTSQTSSLTDTPSAGYIQGSIYYMTN